MNNQVVRDINGNVVSFILENPDHETCIILTHGFTSSKEGSSKKLAHALHGFGFATMRMDLFGHGNSDGDFCNVTIENCANGILALVTHAKSLGYKAIGIYGASFGGACAIAAAARTTELFALCLKAPVLSYEDPKLSSHFVQEEDSLYYVENEFKGLLCQPFIDSKHAYNSLALLQSVTVPVRIIHGQNDAVVGITYSREAAHANKRVELIEVSGVGHFFRDQNVLTLVEYVSAFFLSHNT